MCLKVHSTSNSLSDKCINYVHVMKRHWKDYLFGVWLAHSKDGHVTVLQKCDFLVLLLAASTVTSTCLKFVVGREEEGTSGRASRDFRRWNLLHFQILVNLSQARAI